MGYDLHITRKSEWSDPEGPAISPEEWRSIIESDPELSKFDDGGADQLAAAWNGKPLFWFTKGEIRCKNPDEPTVRKMVGIANRLNATVRGDDGEVYREDGTSFQPDLPPQGAPSKTPGLFSRVATWLRHRKNVRTLKSATFPFHPGQRVKNVFGEPATVLEIDANANAGLGRIRIRLDDGREQSLALVASGLTPLEDAK